MPTLDQLLANRNAPIDSNDPLYRDLLSDLQTNILTSHGRAHTHYFFLRFEGHELDSARAKVLALAQGRWDGAPDGTELDSEYNARLRRPSNDDGEDRRFSGTSYPFSTNLLLSASGYRAIFPDRELPSDEAFVGGLARADERRPAESALHDNPGNWRAPFDRGVHVLYIFAYDDAEQWTKLHEDLQTFLGAALVHEESGYILRNAVKNVAIEPFGYRDAISQPLFYRSQLEQRRAAEGAAATGPGGRWRSFEPLQLVLVHDPNGGKHACGSYAAFRKLKQDVSAFYAQAEVIAEDRKITADKVADLMIGRRLDGMPLDKGNRNDFDFTGSVCPLHAHVRKVNSRETWTHERRIVRRATVFGPKIERQDNGRPVRVNGKVQPEDAELGLLFMCFQRDIAHQFETLQGAWANNPTGGVDPIIGQLPPGRENKLGIEGSGLVYPFKPVVEMLGGEYFFAPSIGFFRS